MDPRVIASEAAGVLMVLEKLSEFGYHEYKEKKLLKKMKVIEEINNLRDVYLANIRLNSCTANTITLPKIFIFDDSANPKSVQLFHMTDAIMDDISNSLTKYDDVQLLSYGHHIANAIRGLKIFYKTRLQRWWWRRGSRDDVTSSVLCYLIEVLNTHCLKFEGCEADIAYVGAIAEFINAFASLHGKGSERFKLLTRVYSNLIRAQGILREHSLTLTLEEQISELVPKCLHTTEALIKAFCKLVTPNKNWIYIEEAELEWLARGIIKPSYQYKGPLGLTHHVKEIPVSDSIIKDWMVRCCTDHLLSFKIDSNLTDNELFIDDKKYSPADLNKKQLGKLKKVFADCENFLTVIAVDKNIYAINKSIEHISESVEVKARTEIFADFAVLIDKLISLQYFCSHLWKRIQQLGEIYIDNPHHLSYTFIVLKGVGQHVSDLSQALTDKLIAYSKQNNDVMFMTNQQKLCSDICKLLNEVQNGISRSIKLIIARHNKTPESKTSVLIDAEKEKMLKIASQIAKEYGIDTKNYVVQKQKIPDLAPPQNVTSLVLNVAEDKKEYVQPLSADLSLAKDINAIIGDIYTRITWIKLHENPDTKPYECIYRTLMVMKWKCENILEEKRVKALSMKEDLYAICNTTLTYLGGDQNKRKDTDTVQDFANTVSNELKSKSFDLHKNKFYGLFFKTDSRNKAIDIDNACHELLKLGRS